MHTFIDTDIEKPIQACIHTYAYVCREARGVRGVGGNMYKTQHVYNNHISSCARLWPIICMHIYMLYVYMYICICMYIYICVHVSKHWYIAYTLYQYRKMDGQIGKHIETSRYSYIDTSRDMAASSSKML